jgi:hypothetical protein
LGDGRRADEAPGTCGGFVFTFRQSCPVGSVALRRRLRAYALHAPHRLGKLALLDPTNCFTGMSLRYLVRALPMLLKPTAERLRAFLQWETGRAPEDPVWQAFLDSIATARRSKVVAMRRPQPEDLKGRRPGG